ncbi:unnamed protein product [Closterium sp. Naga37s-1]|nr:unnamed protein product [Closterium sp. Naga37s-1]
MRASPALEAPRPAALPANSQPVAVPPPQILAPPAPSPAVSAPAPGSRLHLPPVPPVAGVDFVAAGGGAVAALNALQVVADEPLQFLAEALQPPQTRVPEATLGQLHRLADSLHALLLIQVLAHSSLPVIPPETFRGRERDTCLDAADQLAVLLAPVLAAPAEGGAAAAGQLDEAVRGLRRHLRAGFGAAAIGASTLVIRELEGKGIGGSREGDGGKQGAGWGEAGKGMGGSREGDGGKQGAGWGEAGKGMGGSRERDGGKQGRGWGEAGKGMGRSREGDGGKQGGGWGEARKGMGRSRERDGGKQGRGWGEAGKGMGGSREGYGGKQGGGWGEAGKGMGGSREGDGGKQGRDGGEQGRGWGEAGKGMGEAGSGMGGSREGDGGKQGMDGAAGSSS